MKNVDKTSFELISYPLIPYEVVDTHNELIALSVHLSSLWSGRLEHRKIHWLQIWELGITSNVFVCLFPSGIILPYKSDSLYQANIYSILSYLMPLFLSKVFEETDLSI